MHRHILLSVFVLSFLSVQAASQSGGSYRIEKSVIPSGGAMAGGTYSVKVTAGQTSIGPRQTGGSFTLNVGFWVPDQLSPTAANASISGRVMTSGGLGLVNAIVSIADSSGLVRTARSSSFGYYLIEHVEAGQSYTITVISKSHEFVPRTATVVDDLTDFDFIALP